MGIDLGGLMLTLFYNETSSASLFDNNEIFDLTTTTAAVANLNTPTTKTSLDSTTSLIFPRKDLGNSSRQKSIIDFLLEEKIDTRNFTNITNDYNMGQQFLMPDWVYIFMTTLYACIFLIGVAGNLLVIVVILKDRRMRNTANFYLISLSVADLMIIVFCLPVAAYELHAEEVWILGPILCKLAPLLQYLSTNASISTMVAISVERFIVICRPFKVRTYCTKRRAFGIIVVLWAFSFVCAFPLLLFTKHDQSWHQKFQQNVTVCYIDLYSNDGYFFFHQACFYILPGLMLSVIYSKIILTLRRFKCERFGHSPDSRRNIGPGAKSQADTSQQLIVMLSTVVLCYFVCLLPYNFVTFTILVSPETLSDLGMIAYNILLALSRIMFFVNSCSNPILYNVISGKFRSAFLRLFCPRRYKSSGRDSRTMSVRSGDNQDYDNQGNRFDEYRSTGTGTATGSGAGRRGTRRTLSSSDWHNRSMDQRELCSANSSTRNGQRRSEGAIRRSGDRSERRTTDPNTLMAGRQKTSRQNLGDDNNCTVVVASLAVERPLL